MDLSKEHQMQESLLDVLFLVAFAKLSRLCLSFLGRYFCEGRFICLA